MVINNLVPFGGFDNLQNEMTRLEKVVNDVFSDDNVFWGTVGGNYPKVDIIETDDGFVIRVAVAGLKKSDIGIQITAKAIKVKGEKKDEKNASEKYHVRELSSRAFEKIFLIPNSIDRKKISSKLEDGILTITLPKKEEAKEQEKVIDLEIK